MEKREGNSPRAWRAARRRARVRALPSGAGHGTTRRLLAGDRWAHHKPVSSKPESATPCRTAAQGVPTHPPPLAVACPPRSPCPFPAPRPHPQPPPKQNRHSPVRPSAVRTSEGCLPSMAARCMRSSRSTRSSRRSRCSDRSQGGRSRAVSIACGRSPGTRRSPVRRPAGGARQAALLDLSRVPG